MVISIAYWVTLLVTAEPTELTISTGRDFISPKYHQTEYKSVCGDKVFLVQFRDGSEESGRVDRLLIDGRPVLNAAEALQIRAARRNIDRIEIMHCGMDPERPIFRGVMALSEMESRSLGMRHLLFFRLSRQGPEGWQLTLD